MKQNMKTNQHSKPTEASRFTIKEREIMTVTEKRWTELQFYSICLKIYKVNNDMQDIFSMLEVLGTIYKFNTELAKHLAQTLIITLRAKPQRRETALIAREMNIHIDRIAAITDYNKRYLYDLFSRYKAVELTRYYPTWTDQQLQLMQTIVKTITKIKEWTI